MKTDEELEREWLENGYPRTLSYQSEQLRLAVLAFVEAVFGAIAERVNRILKAASRSR